VTIDGTLPHMNRKKTTPVEVSKSQPLFGTQEYEKEFYSQYIKYVQTISDNECKRYVLSYVKSLNKEVELYDQLQSKEYAPYGIHIKMQNDGILLPESEKISLDNFIKNLEKTSNEKLVKKQQNKTLKHSVELKKINKLLGDIEEYKDIQLECILKNKKITGDISSIIISHNIHPSVYSDFIDIVTVGYTTQINELTLAKNKKDDILVEAYSYLAPKQLKSYIDFLKKLQTNIVSSRSVSTRKVRTIKAKTPDKLVKKLQIQEKCDNPKLTSRNKTDLIGANVVFVYNTKTRYMIRYFSNEGITVKGSTLINILPTNARMKKIRKPEIVFSSLNPTNAVFMDKLWSSIKTKESLTKTRINKCCVVLSCLNIKQ